MQALRSFDATAIDELRALAKRAAPANSDVLSPIRHALGYRQAFETNEWLRCRCASLLSTWPQTGPALIDLLDDPSGQVPRLAASILVKIQHSAAATKLLEIFERSPLFNRWAAEAAVALTGDRLVQQCVDVMDAHAARRGGYDLAMVEFLSAIAPERR